MHAFGSDQGNQRPAHGIRLSSLRLARLSLLEG